MIIGGFRSGKTSALINLRNGRNDIDKIYLYARDLSGPKYEYLIKKPEDVGIKYLNNANAFIECRNAMDDVYENIDDYNPSRRRKVLVVFDDMIADIMRNKRLQAIIKKLFIRCRKLNISLVFITESKIKFNTLFHYKNRTELKNIGINHSADIDYNDFKKYYRECTKEPYNFLAIDTTLPASNSLKFRKDLFDSL